MGLLETTLANLSHHTSSQPLWLLILVGGSALFTAAVLLNVAGQLLKRRRGGGTEPPVVFHWVPFLGSTIAYGMDPYDFFFKARKEVCFDPHHHIGLGGFTPYLTNTVE